MSHSILSRWNLERARRRRTRNALQLLSVTGAVRLAEVEVRYRGTDRLLGTWAGETDRLGSEAPVSHRSIWNTDIRELWKRARPGSSPQYHTL